MIRLAERRGRRRAAPLSLTTTALLTQRQRHDDAPDGNGSLAPGASTSFGFTVMKNGTSTPPAIGACAAS
ncbi:hypothetical protein [Streptomyces bullii]|uniref:Uncharacterized protein n=1 Tax=Streptomyces bullii TaxID=349910 RepID=A0ABW0UF88_9ACTN